MAKKKTRRKTTKANGQGRVNKAQAIRDYLTTNKQAMPKEVVPALKKIGIDVSPSQVSMVKARMKIGRAKRQAKQAVPDHDATAGSKTKNSAALDAALILY